MSRRCTGSARRILASSVYGSRTLPATASSKAPKSSRSSNNCIVRLLERCLGDLARESHGETDHAAQDSGRQKTVREQQQARVPSHRMPSEWSSLVECARERPRESFGWTCQAYHSAASAIDLGVERGIWPAQVAM